MSSISEKHSEGYHCNNWGVRIGAMEVALQTGNPFPNENCFNDSIWWIWEDRVKNAHNQEEKQIQNRCQERKDQIGYSDDPSFDPDGWAGDEYWETCRVTNSMYAALVVAMWSKIESFLKSMVSICSDALGKHNEILETVKKFCEDSLQREKPNVTLDHCIKALNKMKDPYKFDEIKKRLRIHGIDVDQCASYTTINAVRILSNSYKHTDGRYRPKTNKAHTQIDQTLLSKWEILKDQNQNEIDYSKLPIQEIVVHSNSFCSDLLGKTKAVLDCHSAQSP